MARWIHGVAHAGEVSLRRLSDVAAGTQRRLAPPWLSGALIAITLAGFGLRLALLDRYPLREDEAIYGYWALHGWHIDPLFLHVWPDKPPAFIWLLTLAFQAWGVSPSAARFLNIVLSTLTDPCAGGDGAPLVGTMGRPRRCLARRPEPLCHQLCPDRLYRPDDGARRQPGTGADRAAPLLRQRCRIGGYRS